MLIICRSTFHDLLTRTMPESLILFNQEFYKQHDGFAMSSPVRPTLAHVFLCYHEKKKVKIELLNSNLLFIEGTLMIPTFSP